MTEDRLAYARRMARASAVAHAVALRMYGFAPLYGRRLTMDEIIARKRRVLATARRAFVPAWRRALAEHDEYVSGKPI